MASATVQIPAALHKRVRDTMLAAGALGSAEDAIRMLMNKEPLGRNVTGEMMTWVKKSSMI